MCFTGFFFAIVLLLLVTRSAAASLDDRVFENLDQTELKWPYLESPPSSPWSTDIIRNSKLLLLNLTNPDATASGKIRPIERKHLVVENSVISRIFLTNHTAMNFALEIRNCTLGGVFISFPHLVALLANFTLHLHNNTFNAETFNMSRHIMNWSHSVEHVWQNYPGFLYRTWHGSDRFPLADALRGANTFFSIRHNTFLGTPFPVMFWDVTLQDAIRGFDVSHNNISYYLDNFNFTTHAYEPLGIVFWLKNWALDETFTDVPRALNSLYPPSNVASVREFRVEDNFFNFTFGRLLRGAMVEFGRNHLLYPAAVEIRWRDFGNIANFSISRNSMVWTVQRDVDLDFILAGGGANGNVEDSTVMEVDLVRIGEGLESGESSSYMSRRAPQTTLRNITRFSICENVIRRIVNHNAKQLNSSGGNYYFTFNGIVAVRVNQLTRNPWQFGGVVNVSGNGLVQEKGDENDNNNNNDPSAALSLYTCFTVSWNSCRAGIVDTSQLLFDNNDLFNHSAFWRTRTVIFLNTLLSNITVLRFHNNTASGIPINESSHDYDHNAGVVQATEGWCHRGQRAAVMLGWRNVTEISMRYNSGNKLGNGAGYVWIVSLEFGDNASMSTVRRIVISDNTGELMQFNPTNRMSLAEAQNGNITKNTGQVAGAYLILCLVHTELLEIARNTFYINSTATSVVAGITMQAQYPSLDVGRIRIEENNLTIVGSWTDWLSQIVAGVHYQSSEPQEHFDSILIARNNITIEVAPDRSCFASLCGGVLWTLGKLSHDIAEFRVEDNVIRISGAVSSSAIQSSSTAAEGLVAAVLASGAFDFEVRPQMLSLNLATVSLDTHAWNIGVVSFSGNDVDIRGKSRIYGLRLPISGVFELQEFRLNNNTVKLHSTNFWPDSSLLSTTVYSTAHRINEFPFELFIISPHTDIRVARAIVIRNSTVELTGGVPQLISLQGVTVLPGAASVQVEGLRLLISVTSTNPQSELSRFFTQQQGMAVAGYASGLVRLDLQMSPDPARYPTPPSTFDGANFSIADSLLHVAAVFGAVGLRMIGGVTAQQQHLQRSGTIIRVLRSNITVIGYQQQQQQQESATFVCGIVLDNGTSSLTVEDSFVHVESQQQEDVAIPLLSFLPSTSNSNSKVTTTRLHFARSNLSLSAPSLPVMFAEVPSRTRLWLETCNVNLELEQQQQQHSKPHSVVRFAAVNDDSNSNLRFFATAFAASRLRNGDLNIATCSSSLSCTDQLLSSSVDIDSKCCSFNGRMMRKSDTFFDPLRYSNSGKKTAAATAARFNVSNCIDTQTQTPSESISVVPVCSRFAFVQLNTPLLTRNVRGRTARVVMSLVPASEQDRVQYSSAASNQHRSVPLTAIPEGQAQRDAFTVFRHNISLFIENRQQQFSERLSAPLRVIVSSDDENPVAQVRSARATGLRSLTLELDVADTLDLYTIHRLQLEISPTALACRTASTVDELWPAMTITFEPRQLAIPATARRDVENAMFGAALFTAFIAGNPMAAAGVNRMHDLQQLAECAFTDVNPLPPVASPLRLSFGSVRGGYQRGAVGGNLLLFLCVYLCLAAGAFYVYRKRRRAHQEAVEQLRQEKQTLLPPPTFVDCCNQRFLPGSLVIPWFFFLHGTVSSAVALLRHAEDGASDVVLSVVALFLFAAFVVWMWWAAYVDFKKVDVRFVEWNSRLRAELTATSRAISAPALFPECAMCCRSVHVAEQQLRETKKQQRRRSSSVISDVSTATQQQHKQKQKQPRDVSERGWLRCCVASPLVTSISRWFEPYGIWRVHLSQDEATKREQLRQLSQQQQQHSQKKEFLRSRSVSAVGTVFASSSSSSSGESSKEKRERRNSSNSDRSTSRRRSSSISAAQQQQQQQQQAQYDYHLAAERRQWLRICYCIGYVRPVGLHFCPFDSVLFFCIAVVAGMMPDSSSSSAGSVAEACSIGAALASVLNVLSYVNCLSFGAPFRKKSYRLTVLVSGALTTAMSLAVSLSKVRRLPQIPVILELLEFSLEAWYLFNVITDCLDMVWFVDIDWFWLPFYVVRHYLFHRREQQEKEDSKNNVPQQQQPQQQKRRRVSFDDDDGGLEEELLQFDSSPTTTTINRQHQHHRRRRNAEPQCWRASEDLGVAPRVLGGLGSL